MRVFGFLGCGVLGFRVSGASGFRGLGVLGASFREGTLNIEPLRVRGLQPGVQVN